jgi:hypothetical protein
MCARSRLRRPPPSCSAPSLSKDEDGDKNAGLSLPSQAICFSPAGCGVGVSGISSVSIALPSAGLLLSPPPSGLSMSTSLTLDLLLECVLFLERVLVLECVVCTALTFDELDAALIRRVYSAPCAEARGEASASSFGSDCASALSLAGSRLLCPLLSSSGKSSLSLDAPWERPVGPSASVGEVEGLRVEGLRVEG